jgi:hypothetical protein
MALHRRRLLEPCRFSRPRARRPLGRSTPAASFTRSSVPPTARNLTSGIRPPEEAAITVYAPPARVVWRGSFPDREKHTRPVDRGSVCRSALRHHGDTTDLSKRALLAPSSTVFEVHPLRRDAIDPVALHGRDEGVGVGRGRHALRVRRPLVTDVNVEARLPGAGPSQA